MPSNKVLQSKKKAFLAAFARTGHVSKSAVSINVDRSLIYKWREKDEKFRADWAAAELEACGALEDEAIERATVGVCRPVLHAGVQVEIKDADGKPQPLWEYTKSDTLLIFLLKGLRPERYRERASIEHTGADGKPLIPLAAWDAMLRAGAEANGQDAPEPASGS